MSYREYWQEFARNGDFDLGTPKSGRTQFRALLPRVAPRASLYASLHDRDPEVIPLIERSISVGVVFTGSNAEERFEALMQRCGQEIVRLQQPLHDGDCTGNGPFIEKPGVGTAFCFGVRNAGFDPKNTAQWRDQHKWMCQWLPKYQDVFRRCLSGK